MIGAHDLSQKKIAVVYDWVDKWGGVERLLIQLYSLFPNATFYTSHYDPQSAQWAADIPFKASFMQSFPSFIKKNRLFSLIFYPYAFEQFTFDTYDVVISVSSSFAKGIITKPNTLHICYLLTPTRYLWVYPELYLPKGIARTAAGLISDSLRRWDYIAAQRPDYYLTLSRHVKSRIKKYYHRDSEALYPSFDYCYWRSLCEKDTVEKMNPVIQELKSKTFFLVVSRLEPYKKVGLVIDALNNDEKLVIVGKGTQKKSLQAQAKSNVIFYEDLSDRELAYLYQNSKALIMPQEEDYGYTSLEAQACYCPVISYKYSGAVETILSDKTGIFFENQTKESLRRTLDIFHTISYNKSTFLDKSVVAHLESFSTNYFNKRLTDYIVAKLIDLEYNNTI